LLPERSGSGGGGGSGQFNDPIYNVELLDGGFVDVKDFRTLKESGKFKPTAPDFAPTDGSKGWYIASQSGVPNEEGSYIAEQVDFQKANGASNRA